MQVLPARWTGAAPELLAALRHAESDAWLSLGLAFCLNVLPLSKQLTALSGSLWSRTLQGARAQRIELLLSHEFHRLKYMLPDKLSFKASAKARPCRQARCVALTQVTLRGAREGPSVVCCLLPEWHAYDHRKRFPPALGPSSWRALGWRGGKAP